MVAMNSVQKARQRLNSYPDAFFKCSKEAVLYGKCVVAADDLKMNDCAKEFQELRNCIRKHVKRPGKL
ncbi:NADH dehydrogenase [ubiquinone] 1 alpha subcomplex assembly factor 8 [Amblyomma americanum]